MSNELWGHALHLAAWSDRRTRAAVAARFVAAQPPSDPLHTLYAALAGRQPPVATCVTDARWADWRPHLAVLLANPSAKPEHDKRTVTQLGDSLMTRGLLYSAQFCYLTAGVEWSRHPMAPLAPTSSSPSQTTQPPRLTLLLAPTHATRLQHFASNRAIFATEIYEYARSLHDPDYVITELQVYKLVMASRLADCGRDGRALAYTEMAARAVSRTPQLYSTRFIAQLAEFADKLKYHEEGVQEASALDDEGAESEGSSRHLRWLHELQALANAHSHAPTPVHHPVPMQEPSAMAVPEAMPAPVPLYWTPEQAAAQHQQPLQQLPPENINYSAEHLTTTVPAPVPAPQVEQVYDYNAQYYTHNAEEGASYATHDWGHAETTAPPTQPLDLSDPATPYAYQQPLGRYHATAPVSTALASATPSGKQEIRGLRPPTARVLPRTLPDDSSSSTGTVNKLPVLVEALEMVEYTRSPGLRRRVHPKHDAVSVGFGSHVVRQSCDSPRTVRRTPSLNSETDGERTRQPLSDLDIQLAHRPCPLGPDPPPLPDSPGRQYVTHRPLHPDRCGTLISNTVDVWARTHTASPVAVASTDPYKPIVFGGTYPIEVPASPLDAGPQPSPPPTHRHVKPIIDKEAHRRHLRKTIEQSLDKFEAIMARRSHGGGKNVDVRRENGEATRHVYTFNIDEPVAAQKLAQAAAAAAPHTFDIDEPLGYF
ncbi:Protein transport protein Sec16A [Eumeta japonica]|uniref:Protein transport protein Sec16A n=1 Tax=Eumeta variegata TaxID=151549 RepID=A0A4C1YWY7_EUMVA|nr:Protein transport protein Sec16A [Eumeta japonica]